MDLQQLIIELQRASDYRGQLTHLARVPARSARFGQLESDIDPRLAERLHASGIEQLYSHQAEAVNAVMAGRHVVVATSTASGKSLCYNLPVLNTRLSDPRKRALYLFPTKALAQDQMRKLREFGLPSSMRFGIYDGDTPASERSAVRRSCCTVLTNPDMLHLGIMPYHTNWADFFRNLAYVVVDEMHIYRGVFGSHVANIMRRLRRICRHYGAVPQFISCSATIGNPEELMTSLTGVKAQVVDDDGSPAGEKLFAFWNPPYIGEGERKSANSEAAALFLELVSRGIRNITFAKARVVAELVYRYARAELERRDTGLASRIMSYRGGYTPEQRRHIEQGLFDGSLIGVTATNALELGIDIGDLDACILTGYPGAIASTWQQAGRAGRGKRTSLAILVALDNPLDQFLMRHPEYLLNGSRERAITDPRNPYILAEHLLCAAYEVPLSELDAGLFGPDMEDIMQVLEESGQVTHRDRWFWTGSGYPAAEVNIRSTGGSGFLICDLDRPHVHIGTVEESNAFQTIHEGAVYLHQGESYVIDRLDLVSRCAYASRREVDYYTVPKSLTDTSIRKEVASKPMSGMKLCYGEVTVTEHVTGYRRKRLLTDEVLDVVDLDLPPQSFATEAFWLVFHPSIERGLSDRGLDLAGGIHGLEHSLIGMLPLYAMCDRADIGGASHPCHPQTTLPTIFVYDAHAGGVGITEAAYTRWGELLEATLGTVSQCPCTDGCPSCIQSPKCGNNNSPLDKQAVLNILSHINRS